MIRHATIDDIDTILSIVRSAQLSLRDLGIDQWQDGYPRREDIAKDIDAEVGYVAVDDKDRVIGYAAIIYSGEEAYSQIRIEDWHTSNEYVVVHRLCVDGLVRRRGVAISLMEYAMQGAIQRGLDGFRIDTHQGNIRMLSMLERLGFKYCGIIYYPSGKRLAYDLKLKI